MACAVTALPILILLMEKLEILRQPIGQRILRYASVDDIAIWGVLALILMDWQRVGKQAGFLVAFARRQRAVPLADACASRSSDRWYVGLIWLAACGLRRRLVGPALHGRRLPRRRGHGRASGSTRRRWTGCAANVLLVLMPVFFLSTGLRTNWQVGGAAVFVAAAVLLVASVTRQAGRHRARRQGAAVAAGRRHR